MTLRLALTDALLTLAERTLGPATRPQATPRAAPAPPRNPPPRKKKRKLRKSSFGALLIIEDPWSR